MTGMPAFWARSVGALNALLSVIAIAMPSAFAEIAALNALTISATSALAEPVHWNVQPSSAHASCAPYCVGTKNGFVVTWFTNTNFHFGCFGHADAAFPAAAAPLAMRPAGSETAAAPSPTRR